MGGFLSGRTSLTTVQTADIAANAIDGTLTKDALVGDYSDVTITAADLLLYGDATDSNNTKRDTVQGVLDLAGGAGLTFISNTDISDAATYDFTAFTAGSYEHYMFVLQNLIPVTDDVHVWCRTSTDGGSSYDDGGSDYLGNALGGNGTADENTTLSKFPATGTGSSTANTIGSASTESGASGRIYLYGPHTTSFTHMEASLMFCAANGQTRQSHGSGSRQSAADVDGFRILFESGNIESGTITAYGLANA